jgi:hypothetical protein
LILSAFASLQTPSNRDRTRGKTPTPESRNLAKCNHEALTISGVVVNSISIAISALTSLDWKFEATNDRQFAEQLLKIVEMQEGEQIVITRKGLVEGLASGVKERKTV